MAVRRTQPARVKRPPLPGGLQKALLGARSQTPVQHPGLGVPTPGQTNPVPHPPIDTGPTHPVQTPVSAPAAPTAPSGGGTNPYTGKPLAANEYVGLPGSEAEHPGMVRIPPPGWWDPNNANYERRNYTIGPHGEIIASEAGFHGDEAHPFDTGREDERNTEFSTRGGGYQRIYMSEPGITPWGPGDQRPDLPDAKTFGVDAAKALSDNFVAKQATSPLVSALGSGARVSTGHEDVLAAAIQGKASQLRPPDTPNGVPRGPGFHPSKSHRTEKPGKGKRRPRRPKVNWAPIVDGNRRGPIDPYFGG